MPSPGEFFHSFRGQGRRPWGLFVLRDSWTGGTTTPTRFLQNRCPPFFVKGDFNRRRRLEIMIGQTLGHYQVTGKLGVGGMGVVYRAHDTRLGRYVALKMLPETFLHDSERRARFEREAHVLASLNHPNIASIYGLEESGNCLLYTSPSPRDS